MPTAGGAHDRFRLGLVGHGRWASTYFLPGSRRVSDVDVVAVCGRDAGRASVFAQEHGIPSAYGSIERMLEEAGVISRYVAMLDQQSVGLPVSVFISIKLESQREEALDRFAKAIQRWPEVLECYLMTGPRDYLLRVVVADLAAYERFLKQKLTRLSGIGSIESSFALEQVKYTNVLPLG